MNNVTEAIKGVPSFDGDFSNLNFAEITELPDLFNPDYGMEIQIDGKTYADYGEYIKQNFR